MDRLPEKTESSFSLSRILTPSNWRETIRRSWWWIIPSALLGIYSFFDTVRSAVNDLLNSWGFIATAPEQAWFPWITMIAALSILAIGVNKVGKQIETEEAAKRAQREQERAEVKTLLVKATKLPALIAVKETRQRKLEGTKKLLETMQKHFDGATTLLQRFYSSIPGNPGMPDALDRQLRPHIDGIAQCCSIVEHLGGVPGFRNDVPKFAWPHVNTLVGGERGSQPKFDPANNKVFVELVNSYVSVAGGKLETVRVYCRDEETALSEISIDIDQEIAKFHEAP
jgi:hypothetical protein